MLRRTLGVVFVNVIVFEVLAELLALLLYYNETLVRRLYPDAHHARVAPHSLLPRAAAESVLHDAIVQRRRARVARSDASPLKKGAENGYPLLVKESEGLKSRVNFLNATAIFDRESAAVYIDDCCHYTLRGNQLLADAIARQILTSNGPWH